MCVQPVDYGARSGVYSALIGHLEWNNIIKAQTLDSELRIKLTTDAGGHRSRHDSLTQV